MDGVFAAPDEMKVWDLIAKIQVLQVKRILEVRIEFMSQFSKNEIIILFRKLFSYENPCGSDTAFFGHRCR